ncbi:cytochrome b5-related protein isoform X2 [Agrilus planipennis]|nr:cytochrome b5-related protein isoform X2 [Agrilus planipennis]XP_018322161.1 cytochrome b5-related protein isoform X2 [Agrilus planipennis]XP_018322162.1 cytochrome b5-related protein isoform X2 [Agrilus planipennis]
MVANMNGEANVSSLGIKYPTHRDNQLHTGDLWLLGKKEDDGAENLWRIHDNLYDLSDFVKNHPGGSDWLVWTKGTDITEAFESHHLTENAQKLLPKYFLKKAAVPRNCPFTFEDNGFYRTLKRQVAEALRNIPDTSVTRSKVLADALLWGYISFAMLAANRNSYIFAVISGIFLALVSIASHNFFHQRDNIRMYYFNFTLMSFRQWRITHVLSHHLYTNTINDIEISTVEPFLQYLPGEKNIIYKTLCWIYSPIIYSFLFIGSHIRLILYNLIWNSKFYWDDFLPYSIPLLMYLVGGKSLIQILCLYATIVVVASIHFGIVGLNAAHHHPDIFHDGDTPRPKEELDWGIHQLDAVMDRTDITGSHFLVLTNFGDHGLHHLFPTIDHGKLEYLYPVLEETCKKFGIELRMTTQMDLVKGQFKQLLKVKPRKKPPKPLSATKL